MRTFLNVLASLSPILVVLLGGVGWLYRHERERREGAERQVSPLKYQAYVKLLDAYFDAMKQAGTKRQMSEKQVRDRMWDAHKDLLLYGSDEVVRLYLLWLDRMRGGTLDFHEFAEIVIAIRRDMGNAKTKVTGEDVLRQILTDYDAAKDSGQLVRRRNQ